MPLPIMRSLSLDVARAGAQGALYARKGDSQCYGVFVTLVERGTPVVLESTYAAYLRATKPDGTVVMYSGLISDARVKAYFGSQAFTAEGIMECEILINDANGAALYSPRFDVLVEPVAMNDEGVESSSEFTALQDALSTMQAATLALGEALERAEVFRVYGHYDTLEALKAAVPNPTPGNAYTVGAEVPYDIYVYTGDVDMGDEGWITVNPVQGPRGIQGLTGARGALIYSGTAITGTSTTPTAYETGIEAAQIGDRYLYDGATFAQIGNEYRCTLGGDEDTALWVFDRNTRGPQGIGNVNSVDAVEPDEEGALTLSAVRYVAQSLTGEQQGIARANLAAAGTNEAIIQAAAMPTANAANLGRIVRYIGVTTTEAPIYQNGYFYVCVGSGEPVAYAWERVSLGLVQRVVTVTLEAGDWSAVTGGLEQTVSVADIPTDCIVTARPAEASREQYDYACVRCTAAGSGSVTFFRPDKAFVGEYGSYDLSVYVIIQEV